MGVLKGELITCRHLQRGVGILGLFLPAILPMTCWFTSTRVWLPSISEYYGSDGRNFLVGVLFVIAGFFFAYRGYANRDNLCSKLASISMMFVALFPATYPNKGVQAIHYVSATTLFLTLAFFSLFIFTKTDNPNTMTREKRGRNWYYRFSGTMILLCMGGMLVFYTALRNTAVASINPIYWLETIALGMFATAWLMKSGWIYPDPDD
jgi:hypothetical protein